MIHSTQTQFHFSPLTWAQLLFLVFQPRAAAQSAVQPVPTFASHQNWDPSIAAMVGALFCAFLFVGFFSVYLHHCSDVHIATAAAAGGEWRCSCSEGIDRKVLDTFPILVYSTIKDHKMGKFALECAVCLSEFKDYETLRLLPKCNHVFHPDCIQAWLSSHVTCPVCREKLNPDFAQVAITLPNEARDEHDRTEQHQNLQDQSSMNSGEDDTVTVHEAPVKSGRFVELTRSNSTGHCEVEGGGNDRERYTLRLPEDVRKYVLLNHGSMRRSASYNVITPTCRNESQGLQRDHVSPTA